MQQKHIIEYDKPVELSFARRWHEYNDVYSFEFKASKKLPFLAGQNARIVIPNLPEEVAAHSLSFANPPEAETVLFSMHTGSKSPYKKAMLELKEGDVVHLVKIKGETFLPEDESRPVVLIAGGIGVTPFRSILFDIKNRNASTPAMLVHVCSGEYLYGSELSQLDFEQYRIKRPDIENTLSKAVEKYPEGMYYIAGPPSFIETIKKTLERSDISGLRIRMSKFTGYESLVE